METTRGDRGDLMRRMANIHTQVDLLRKARPPGCVSKCQMLQQQLAELHRQVYGNRLP
jgi:hypothetical protein